MKVTLRNAKIGLGVLTVCSFVPLLIAGFGWWSRMELYKIVRVIAKNNHIRIERSSSKHSRVTDIMEIQALHSN